jgi:type I restriction enzyme S subunit
MNKAMKDSGISWIGDIPIGWNIDTIGSLYYPRNEKVSDKDYPPLSVGKMGVVPQLETAAKTDDGDNRKLVRVGDFAINSRSDRRGSCGISSYDGSVSLINTILTPRIKMNPQYFNWLFHTESFADEFYKWGHGIVDDLWTTRWQEMKRISIAVPPLPEQKAIADYLDKKCTEIDELLSLQEKIIDELTAYKQSIITEAVTKGLNPDVPMKDSGIEWIGYIPKHWREVRFFKINYIRGRLGWKGLKAEEYVEQGYPFLSAFNIVSDKISWDDLNYITQQRYDESPEIKLSIGDILIVKDGAGIGKCARVSDLPHGEATVNSSLAVITPKNGMDYNYQFYYILSMPFQRLIWFLKIGMGVPHLTQENMRDIIEPCPPIEEQKAIAAYLDKKCSEIDKMISIKQTKIETLKEYKKSIIYEFVTGKKDVLDF